MKVDPKDLPFFIEEELFLIKEESNQETWDPSPKSSGLVVVESSQSVDEAKKTDSFLHRVLAAVQVQLNDVEIISVNEFQEDSLGRFSWALLFGGSRLLKDPVTPYQVESGPCTYMAADALQEIELERDKKTKLWSGLKIMFNKD